MLNINLNLPTIPTQDEKDAMDGANTPSTTNVFATINDVPTKTSDLVNDGDDGNAFISLQDLPSNIILYPTTVASDIGGYFKMVSSITDPSYNTIAVDVSTGAISGTAQLISSLATSANIIVGNPGVFDITTIGNIRKVSGTGEAEFFFRVYKRNLAGTETLIIQSNNTLPVTNGGYAEFSATGLWNDGLFISTDRIVIKYYANRIAGGSNPTYEFQFGGSTPVRTLVPIPLTVVPFITLDEVADVTISGVANNDLLAYDNATSLWKNKTASTLGLAPLASPTFTGTVVLPSTTSIGNVSNTEIEYLDGVTSAIQTQINAKSSLGFTLQGGWSTSTPADSITYYANSYVALVATTPTNLNAFYITKDCTLKAAYINLLCGAASGETVTYNAYIGGSATLIATNTSTLTNIAISNTSMSLACTAGQTVYLQIVCPAWATNPTSHRGVYTFYFE